MMVKPNIKRSKESYRSYEMLSDLMQQTYTLTDNLEENKKLANELFESSNDQTGFYALLKVLMAQAVDQDKGKLFNKVSEYLSEVESTILGSGAEVSLYIVSCRAELVINWCVNKGSGSVDWAALKNDLVIITSSNEFKKDINWRFYLAVAFFHLREVSDANAIFGALRRESMPIGIRNELRCFYVDINNNKKTLQGEISGGTKDKFIYCAELSTDVLASSDFRQSDNATVHFYVGFNYYGPKAVPVT